MGVDPPTKLAVKRNIDRFPKDFMFALSNPLIIIFLGMAVGIILIAMYLPMFQMSNSF